MFLSIYVQSIKTLKRINKLEKYKNGLKKEPMSVGGSILNNMSLRLLLKSKLWNKNEVY